MFQHFETSGWFNKVQNTLCQLKSFDGGRSQIHGDLFLTRQSFYFRDKSGQNFRLYKLTKKLSEPTPRVTVTTVTPGGHILVRLQSDNLEKIRKNTGPKVNNFCISSFLFSPEQEKYIYISGTYFISQVGIIF